MRPKLSVLDLVAQTADRSLSSGDAVQVAVVVLIAAVVTRFFRPALRAVLTRLAQRAKPGAATKWRARTPRLLGETVEQAELRRRQRIVATASGLSRLLSIALWVGVIGFALQRADIDPTVAVSAAGFLGAAIAFGGQHSVNDFLTGLHILLEDRFGEGDQLRFSANGTDTTARVTLLGAFSTRLEGSDATYHVPNRELTRVMNLSQRGSSVELAFEPSTEVAVVQSKDAIETAVRKRYVESVGYDASRDGLVVDTVEQQDQSFTVNVRTARPLTESQQRSLTRARATIDEAAPDK